MAISPQQLTIYLYNAHRAVIFAMAQLSCISLLIKCMHTFLNVVYLLTLWCFTIVVMVNGLSIYLIWCDNETSRVRKML